MVDEKKEPRKIERNIFKLPDTIFTRDKKKRGRVFRHAYVTTVAQVICAENIDVDSTLIRNIKATTVWIGNSDLVPGENGNGYPVFQNEVLTIDKSYGEVFAATEEETSVLAIMEE